MVFLFRTLAKKYEETALIKLIIIGLIIGIVIAVAAPQLVPVVSVLGDFFVKALKGVAPLLVFVLVMNAMAQKSNDTEGSMKPVIELYVIGTFFASLVGVCASFLFPTTLHLQVTDAKLAPPSGIVEVLHNLVMSIVDNPIHALSTANYISILAWAVLIGIAFHRGSDNTKNIIADAANAAQASAATGSSTDAATSASDATSSSTGNVLLDIWNSIVSFFTGR